MNKEIKVIDLLNMIAEGKEIPEKIKINEITYKYQGDDYLYEDEDKKEYWLFSAGYSDRFVWLDSFLKTKVEIIEEDNNKIEYLNIDSFSSLECKAIGRRVNQIIDKINNME